MNSNKKGSTPSLIDKFFRDKNGERVLLQPPNLPIVGWFIFTVLEKLVDDGQLNTLASLLAFGCVFTWAWLELFSGANYFRRLLGLLVLVAVITNRLNLA
jgi:hypothetical protein